MRAILVLMFMVLAVGTGVAYATGAAYGNDGVTQRVAALGIGAMSEPTTLVLSGGLLIALGGAVRRFTF